jgi:hypothetical protein
LFGAALGVVVALIGGVLVYGVLRGYRGHSPEPGGILRCRPLGRCIRLARLAKTSAAFVKAGQCQTLFYYHQVAVTATASVTDDQAVLVDIPTEVVAHGRVSRTPRFQRAFPGIHTSTQVALVPFTLRNVIAAVDVIPPLKKQS